MVIVKKGEKFLNVLLIAGILGFLALIGITNICHYNFSMDADIASDAVLGRLIWDSKEIIPSTWYIAEETRIICMANVAALFYGLTHNMTLAAGLACCTMTILILWSIFYFGAVLHLERKEKFLLGFLCLMLPADHAVLELSYLFASYYAVHVVVLFLTFGIYLEVHGGKPIKWPRLAIGIFFSLILGMQGARGILVIYGPLFGMAVIWNLYRIYCGKKPEKSETIISLWTVALLVVSFIGMLFPLSTGQELSRNIRNGFHKLCFNVVPDMLDAMGFDGSQPVAGKICAALLMLITVYLLLDILYRMCRKKEIDTVEWGFLIICSSPAVTAFMVAFTTVESTERYYFLFSYVMAYAVVLFFKKVKESTAMQQGMRICLGIVLAALTIVHYCNIYLPVLRAEEPPQGEVYDVVRYLEENDFEMAYSTFANANMMTVLSNGKVRVVSVDSVAEMDICKWMSSTDWYVPNVPFDERTAYIIPESEMEVFDAFLSVHEDDMKLETQIGRFFIYSSEYNFSCLENQE